jgi:hypothetical protein
VPLNAAGTGPAPFLIVANGFTAGQTGFVEICDGVPSTTPGYDTTIDCDNIAATTGVSIGPSGVATFDPTITQGGQHPFAITVFDGPSPGGVFNCLFPGEPDPNNGLPSWGSSATPPNGGGSAPCQAKVSSSVAGNTSDQTFFSLINPHPSPPVPETHYAIFLPIGALLLLTGGYAVFRLRHRSVGAAA